MATIADITVIKQMIGNIKKTTFTFVDHGTGCIGKPVPKRTPPGAKVRVRLEANGIFLQCRPGVVLHTKGHMGPGWVYVQFDENVGAWFERDQVSLEEGD